MIFDINHYDIDFNHFLKCFYSNDNKYNLYYHRILKIILHIVKSRKN